jgi:hypothetical protein
MSWSKSIGGSRTDVEEGLSQLQAEQDTPSTSAVVEAGRRMVECVSAMSYSLSLSGHDNADGSFTFGLNGNVSGVR